jgi:UDPglucose--hexose-1-phosphate uridylyltransferase
MPELRRHYFLEEYCIIASERSKRPSDFLVAKAVPGDEKTCPFCPGNEEMTPPNVAVYTDKGVLSEGPKIVPGWQLRVFPNAFAAMVPEPAPATAEWIALAGHGYHEVIVDSSLHGENPADFGLDHMERLVQVYRDRYIHYSHLGEVKYISIFKNWGKEAGASLSHSHSQLITLPILPPLMKREQDAISQASFCPFCNIVQRERTSCRLIAENDHWEVIAPFYSLTPYETWILPKKHLNNLAEMTEQEGKDLAALLKEVLGSLRSLLNDPPYNLMIFQQLSGYHLNIRIQPALAKIAGFERSTGIYINSVPPERAAAELSAKMHAAEKLINYRTS